MHTVDSIVESFNGLSYNDVDPSKEMCQSLAADGIVIVYGASDDLVEFAGAIQDELGGPGKIYLSRAGLYYSSCDDEDCPHESVIIRKHSVIVADWCKDPGVCWSFTTDIPHKSFDIIEDGEVFCRAIVFNLKDVPELG